MQAIRALADGWILASAPAGSCLHPSELPWRALTWFPATVPGTVAQSLQLPLEGDERLEAADWWYRCEFSVAEAGGKQFLRFAGLATFAEVWLNGKSVLRAKNMFREYSCDVSGVLQHANELMIVFRAMVPELAVKRPRPRWKTGLLDQQNLRFVRTSLLGRMPGWTPKLPAVGPWRGVSLVREPEIGVRGLQVKTAWAEGVGGELSVAGQGFGAISSAKLTVAGQEFAMELGHGNRVFGTFNIENIAPWWPHTHGAANRYEAVLRVSGADGVQEFAAFRVGFRTGTFMIGEGVVQLSLNGQRIFCRGACWTLDDVRALDGLPEQMLASLEHFREAGGNMIRVGGTMVYPAEPFLDACDRLGIMVWQDFMFANMDYPFSDEAFASEVAAETDEFLVRASKHPCLTVLCGGSEVAQQAAMMGVAPSEWLDAEFTRTLAEKSRLAGVAYVASTPIGGALPFHTSEGLTHYYGVGAYRRPLADARASQVRFTPECLGFSNLPEPEKVERWFGVSAPPTHHPAWKAGIPRDAGAGWDFEDIRDHYVGELFGGNAVALRTTDLERYHAVSRVVTGELYARVFAEWRRENSGCGGGLVWFWKDLRRGAGWGLLDAEGSPKPAYWFLRRAWRSRCVLITDEGLNGVSLHVHNEAAEKLDGIVEVELFNQGRVSVGKGGAPVSLTPFSSQTFSGEGLLPHFTDVSYAYRFGPPRHDVVVARLRAATGEVLSEDAWLPLGLQRPSVPAAVVQAKAEALPGGDAVVTLESATFLQAISFSAPGYFPDDAYFPLCPASPRQIVFRKVQDKPFKLTVGALNLDGSVTVRLAG